MEHRRKAAPVHGKQKQLEDQHQNGQCVAVRPQKRVIEQNVHDDGRQQRKASGTNLPTSSRSAPTNWMTATKFIQ